MSQDSSANKSPASFKHSNSQVKYCPFFISCLRTVFALGRISARWGGLERRSWGSHQRHCSVRDIGDSSGEASFLQQSNLPESCDQRRKQVHDCTQSWGFQSCWTQFWYSWHWRVINQIFVLKYIKWIIFSETVYETPYSLLDNLSPAYREAFGNHLTDQLLKLQKQREEENSDWCLSVHLYNGSSSIRKIHDRSLSQTSVTDGEKIVTRAAVASFFSLL